MLQPYLGVLCLLQLLLLCSSAAKVPAIIVFGDSSVDSGNNNFVNTIAKSNYEPYGRDFDGGKPTGRFSNGRLATDFISQAFNLSPAIPAYLDPAYGIKDFAAGVCFASAAAGYDNATSDVAVEYLKEYIGKLKGLRGEERARQSVEQGLYIISMGTNDFVENYYAVPGGRSSAFTVEEYQDFLVGIAERFVGDIAALGARKIDLTGLLPMGCLPLERSMNLLQPFGACNQDYNRVAREFNAKLHKMMEKLRRQRPELSLVYSNVYDFFDAVIKSPSSYGFEEAAAGCCGASGLMEMGYFCKSPLTCKDADKYVFWDAIHPTQKMNQLLADYIVNQTLARFM